LLDIDERRRRSRIRTLREFACSVPNAQRAPRLAVGNVEANDPRAILALESDQVAAGIEHCDDERIELALARVRKRCVDDLSGEHQSHG